MAGHRGMQGHVWLMVYGVWGEIGILHIIIYITIGGMEVWGYNLSMLPV